MVIFLYFSVREVGIFLFLFFFYFILDGVGDNCFSGNKSS